MAGAILTVVPDGSGTTGFPGTVQTGPNGQFDIPALVGGGYTLHANLDDSGTSIPFRFVVSEGDVENVVLTLTEGFDMPVRVIVDGELPPGGFLALRLGRQSPFHVSTWFASAARRSSTKLVNYRRVCTSRREAG